MSRDDYPDDLPVPSSHRWVGSGEASEVGDQLAARIEALCHQAAGVRDRNVIGPHGQNLTVAEAIKHAKRLDTQIDVEQRAGSQLHRRVPRMTKFLTFLTVGVVDLPIMLWLAASVFNVDWTQPLGVPLLISVVVSALATGGAASALHHLGRNLRQYKNKRRQLVWAELSMGAKGSLIAVGLLVGLMGIVMFVRVETEGALSGLDELSVLLAVLVALVLVISALLVFWTAFRDGSLDQDDLCHYSDSVRPYLELARSYREQAQDLAIQRALLTRYVPRSRDEAS